MLLCVHLDLMSVVSSICAMRDGDKVSMSSLIDADTTLPAPRPRESGSGRASILDWPLISWRTRSIDVEPAEAKQLQPTTRASTLNPKP